MQRVIMIGLILLVASTIGAQCQNPDRKSFAEYMRQALEGDVKKEFEKAKKLFLREQKRRNRKGGRARMKTTRSAE